MCEWCYTAASPASHTADARAIQSTRLAFPVDVLVLFLAAARVFKPTLVCVYRLGICCCPTVFLGSSIELCSALAHKAAFAMHQLSFGACTNDVVGHASK